MQSARSFPYGLSVVFFVILAVTLAPAAPAAIPGQNSLSPARVTEGRAGVTVVRTSGISLHAIPTIPQAPAIKGLNPVSATAGGTAFTLTINGSNFTSASTSRWGMTPLATTFRSSTQLAAAVPANLIAAAGTASITVETAGILSSAAAFTITLAPPAITSLSPASAVAGQAFTMTINGKNFVRLAAAKWGSTALATTYVSGTQLTAAIPAGLVSTQGKALVTVKTAGGTSPAATFAVVQPKPTIASLNPSSVLAGSQAFTLTVNGANYLSGAGASVVKWNSTVLATTYVSGTQLTAVVPASLIGNAGTANVAVVTSAGTSSSLPFTVSQVPPAITSFSPGQVTAGYGAFVIMVLGTHFTSTATVNLGSTPLVTTALGGSTLLANVPASLVTAVGTLNLTVTTAGGTSAPASFRVIQPQPMITSLSPASAPAGGAKFTLTINGTNFAANSQARMGTTWLTTTYVSSTQLTAQVYSSSIASAGQTGVTVYIPGTGWSPSASFTITSAPPAIASLSPASLTAGSAGFMMTIKGTAFTPTATCIWGTTPLGTIYVSPTQLVAAVPASLVVDSGAASVTVTTQAGTSSPATFVINPARPAITRFSPGMATAGRSSFTLSLDGVYFTPTSTVMWGSTPLTTAYIDSTKLTAAVPANLVASAGSVAITVTAPAGTSGPAAFTVYSAPKIVTTSIPSGTAGSAYSGPVQVTGGVPGYNWTVQGLPQGLSFSKTSGSKLTIAGTPTEPGTVTFQVSVEDNGGGAAGPVPYTLQVADGPNGASNSRLKGSYVCLFQGFVYDDGSRSASLASFQADGNGYFTTGVFDTNSQDIGSASGIINGSYSVGSDLNGLASIHTVLTDGAAGYETTQWAIALSGAAQPAQEFRMVEDDDLGQLPSGKQGIADCRLASPGFFAASTISGSSFAFGLEGEDRSGTPKASVGVFSASAGAISSGSIDLAQGGSASIQSSALTGSYTVPDANTGRFKIDLKGSSRITGLTAYIIDSNRIFVLDNTSNNGEQAGSMHKQQSLHSVASLNGSFVLSMRGAEFNNSSSLPSGYDAALIVGSGDGAGNLTIKQSYSSNNGAYSAGNANQGPLALDFDSTHPGRALFQTAGGATYLYLFDTNSAFALSVGDNGSLDSGWLEPQVLPQTQTSFTSSALAGNYLFGQLPLLNAHSIGRVGEFSVTASGGIDAALTTTAKNSLSWDQAASMTYAWEATAPGAGTFVITKNAQASASCVVVNASRFVCIPRTDAAPSVQVAER